MCSLFARGVTNFVSHRIESANICSCVPDILTCVPDILTGATYCKIVPDILTRVPVYRIF
jgi:hypothetical protein